MSSHWDEIERRLASLGCSGEIRLNAGATAEDLRKLEAPIGVKLPASLKESLSRHDGQGDGPGLVYGYRLLPVDEIRSNWDDWRSIDEAAMNDDCAEFMSSRPGGYVEDVKQLVAATYEEFLGRFTGDLGRVEWNGKYLDWP